MKPASVVLASLIAALAALFVAAAVRSYRFPLDSALFLIGAGAVLGCYAFWILEWYGPMGEINNPKLVVASLLVSPLTVYLLALVFGIRFFLTKLAGWPRYVYLIGAISSLSPLIFIVGLGMIAAFASRNG